MDLADKNYGIWLSWNNQEEEFELPILPSEIGVKEQGDGSEHSVFGLGKINVIKDKGLAEYTIESFFPAHWRATAGNVLPYISASDVREPKMYVENIKRWWGEKRPIRFKAKTPQLEVNMAVSIEGFEYKEVAGSPGDIFYSLRLKEYKFFSAQRWEVVADGIAEAGASRPDERVQPKTYTMVAGDTLWSVAQKVLGNGARWREIQSLNSITDAEVKRLPIGKVLRLP